MSFHGQLLEVSNNPWHGISSSCVSSRSLFQQGKLKQKIFTLSFYFWPKYSKVDFSQRFLDIWCNLLLNYMNIFLIWASNPASNKCVIQCNVKGPMSPSKSDLNKVKLLYIPMWVLMYQLCRAIRCMFNNLRWYVYTNNYTILLIGWISKTVPFCRLRTFMSDTLGKWTAITN